MKQRRIACTLLSVLLLLPLASCGREENALAPVPEEAPLPPAEEVLTEEEVRPEEDLLQPAEAPAAVRYLCTTADAINLRTGAGTKYPSLGRVEKGVLLFDGGREDGWYQTRYRGRKAFVSAAYITPLSLPRGREEAEAVIEAGLSLLGVPYVYGATRLHDGRGSLLKGFTAEEFDCSSLMQYLFYEGAGILLDVTTRTQIKQGMRVQEAERGDLLFFTNASRKNKTGIERVGHVALYLGDGYILHTASDYAKIEKLTPLRQSYFIEARRMF